MWSRQVLMIGNCAVDPSHVVWEYRGLLCCAGCGHHAVKHASAALQRPCVGSRRSAYGRRCWDLFLSGRLPIGVSEWPDETKYWYRL